MKLYDNIMWSKPRGHLTIEAIDTRTGETVDRFGSNVVVLDARNSFIRAVSLASSDYRVQTIKIGDDVGTGTLDNPESADETYDENTMSVVYHHTDGLNVGSQTNISTTFNATISGTDVMSNYPTDDSKAITSAALHTGNGKVFAYKRFSQISVSNFIDLNITWTITF